MRRLTGDYPAAAQAREQALGIYRDIGDREGEAEARNKRGTLHRVNGDLAQAEGCHQQALELARAIANSWDEAHALVGLGRCALAVGHPHSKPWHRAGAPAAGWPRYETQIRPPGFREWRAEDAI